jgi:MFS family permease
VRGRGVLRRKRGAPQQTLLISVFLLQSSAMASFVITLVALGALLLWLLAWERRSRIAVGVVIGVVVGLIAGPALRSITADHVPVWLPALPFALIAVALFAFGLFAWFWGEEEPRGLRETQHRDVNH